MLGFVGGAVILRLLKCVRSDWFAPTCLVLALSYSSPVPPGFTLGRVVVTAETRSLSCCSQPGGSRGCAVPTGAALPGDKRTERFEIAHACATLLGPLSLPCCPRGHSWDQERSRGRWSSLHTPAVMGALL